TAATAVLLALGAWGLTRLLGRLRGRVGVAWRFGLANVSRRGGASIVQVVAIGLGLMVLLVLTLVRTDLLAGWRASLPPEAPNRFLINVQPGEVEALQAELHAAGLGAATLHPMVRGRLTQIGERPVSAADYPEPRAQRLVEREFNLSWAEAPQPDNRIVAGRWFGPGARAEVSVEQGLAETLGIRLGDRLRFAVAGQSVEGTVTSLRSVEWDSFHVNFFVVFPPGALDGLPATWITSFHLPAGRQALIAELVRAHPSVTVLDIDALLSKVREIIERVVLGVEYVFLFTLAAGLAVLYAAIQATRDERRYEAALARTLGASRRVVLQGLIAEFAVLGLLAGVLAAAGASALGWGLAQQVFDFPYRPDPLLWLAGAAAGVFGVGLAGLAGTRAVLDQPPLATLRAGV
nr:FtsX-like permease family protein [Plasticicumulans sp.]